MSGQLLPAPALTAVLPPGLTAEQRIALWADLLDACDQLLMAGLRRRIGPNGDLPAAYRAWYKKQMEEHDRMMQRMVNAFEQRSRRDAR